MSLSGVISSTVSTVFNNIIIVVDDINISRRNDISQQYDDPRLENDITNNLNFSQPLVISLTTETTYVYVSEGVASGFSQEKIISVMCMLVIFSIFGCLGNGLVLYVFTKKSDKVTSTIFILALAWTDFFTCLIIMPFTVTNIGLDSRLYLDFLCKAYEFLITSNVPLSAFIMVAIAVDRYFSICHPFMRVVTPKRARITIVCLVLTACTLGSITACIYGVWEPSLGVSSTSADNSTQINNHRTHDDVANPHLSSNYNVTSLYEPYSWSWQDRNVLFLNRTAQHEPRLNSTGESGGHPAGSTRKVIKHSEGLCVANELIFSEKFTSLYQKIYISFYIICLLAVFTLYFFIYRSVAERREWRRKQKSFSHSPLTAVTAVVGVDSCNKPKDVSCRGNETVELAPQNSSNEASNSDSKQNGSGNDSSEPTGRTKPSSNKSAAASTASKNCGHENGVESMSDKKTNRERRDFNFLANIRTAIMLFVVTLVFIISFLPAWLMATNIIHFEIVIFYMHFIYNVANPVIYAFMNQSFRKELKRVFQRGTHLLRGR